MDLEEVPQVLALHHQVEIQHIDQIQRRLQHVIQHLLCQVLATLQQEVIHRNQRITDLRLVLVLQDHTHQDLHHQDQVAVHHQAEVVQEDNINGIIFNTETL